MTARLARVFVVGFAGAVLTQCVDTSPLAYVPEKDGGSRDGAVGDGALIQSCRQCLAADAAPCRAQYDACAQIPKCTPALDCLLDKGCFESPNIQDRIDCGLPCLQAEGVLAGDDPATQALGQINVCIVVSCSDACFAK